MATIYSNMNLVGMNTRQLRRIARQLGILFTNNTTNAALITAIKAK